MHIAEYLKFSIRGFSPKRMGYLLDLVSLSFVPVHFIVSCKQSGGIACFASFSLLVVFILCVLTTPTDKQRFMPFVFGIFVVILHSLFVH